MKIHFVWGAGGVGKSHTILKLAHEYSQANQKTLVVTLDPSKRLFDLLHLSSNSEVATFNRWGTSFDLKTLNALKLFDELNQKKTASPWLKVFYSKMVEGLQEFRDYLLLIQLSDEILSSKYDLILIDTPPLQEALGLQRSAKQLKAFFSAGLVEFAIKTNRFSFVQAGLKKIFEMTSLFVGKKTADQLFDFLTWLSLHSERFQKAAQGLEDLFYSTKTNHHFILSPESSVSLLDEIQLAFERVIEKKFILNRSVSDFVVPSVSPDSFTSEFSRLKAEEVRLMAEISKRFVASKVNRIPCTLMGDDTLEELDSFVLGDTSNCGIPVSERPC